MSTRTFTSDIHARTNREITETKAGRFLREHLGFRIERQGGRSYTRIPPLAVARAAWNEHLFKRGVWERTTDREEWVVNPRSFSDTPF